MLLRKLSGSERNRPAKTGRRSGLLPDAFSLRLPKVAPRLVLPPTPSSPDDTLAGQTVLGWRPEDDHEAKRKLLEQESVEQVEGGLGIALEGHPHEVGQLPYTPANTPPPDSYVAEPKAAKASDQISFNHLIASGYALHPVLLNNYTVLEELGAGGYGVVVRAVREQDMQEVAIKIVWRNRMPKEAWLAVTGWEERLLTTPVIVTKEAHILRQISHPGVISYIDYFDDHNFLYLVMEHFGTPWNLEMTLDASERPDARLKKIEIPINTPPPTPPTSAVRPVGPIRRASCDLFECLEAYERLPEEKSRFVFKQLADTVCHLHRNGIVHCDLKDENIVIDADFRVKIIDFGSAQMLDPLKPAPYHTKFRGTITFAAPEILRGEIFQAPQAEVWALGCILSILLTGKGPFPTADAAKRAQISEPAVPIPSLAFDLMMGCLRFRPQDRLNICQVKDHPWLTMT